MPNHHPHDAKDSTILMDSNSHKIEYHPHDGTPMDMVHKDYYPNDLFIHGSRIGEDEDRDDIADPHHSKENNSNSNRSSRSTSMSTTSLLENREEDEVIPAPPPGITLSLSSDSCASFSSNVATVPPINKSSIVPFDDFDHRNHGASPPHHANNTSTVQPHFSDPHPHTNHHEAYPRGRSWSGATARSQSPSASVADHYGYYSFDDGDDDIFNEEQRGMVLESSPPPLCLAPTPPPAMTDNATSTNEEGSTAMAEQHSSSSSPRILSPPPPHRVTTQGKHFTPFAMSVGAAAAAATTTTRGNHQPARRYDYGRDDPPPQQQQQQQQQMMGHHPHGYGYYPHHYQYPQQPHPYHQYAPSNNGYYHAHSQQQPYHHHHHHYRHGSYPPPGVPAAGYYYHPQAAATTVLRPPPPPSYSLPPSHNSSSSAAAASYDAEVIGHPSLRIFKLRLPEQYLSGVLDRIVAGCEAFAATRPNGWQTNLYSLTKQDLALVDVGTKFMDLARPITQYMCKAICDLYHADQVQVDRNQPHVLKFSEGHTGVGLHHDRCDVTANLMLSRSHTYVAGGYV
jgi:hypothetical protein